MKSVRLDVWTRTHAGIMSSGVGCISVSARQQVLRGVVQPGQLGRVSTQDLLLLAQVRCG